MNSPTMKQERPLFAQDSKRLVVMDEKVKHRDLFGYILPRVIAWFFLLGLTTYGILKSVPSPWLDKFDAWTQSVAAQKIIFFIVLTVLLIFCSWVFFMRKRK